MSKIVIRAENINKKYIIRNSNSGKYTALRDVIYEKVKNVYDFTLNNITNKKNELPIKFVEEEFYALRNISFEINQGDSVGIIGRNGAGKSTLLKVLSRITEPSSGQILLKGRVSSLLEVGTGFHPELTGRENIFLNGAILGMKRNEIKSKFDEIVDFSGVEKFLDTPVKRYSSGMYVRLAFSVAANLQSEILIVDEVLAVGDAEFQKKCLGKMDQISKGDGRTVLFVSHNLGAVNQLCNKALYLANGQIQNYSNVNEVIKIYMQNSSFENNHIWHNKKKLFSKANFNLIKLLNSNSESQRIFSIGDDILIELEIYFNNPNELEVKTCIEIKASDGTKIANVIDIDSNFQVIYDGNQSCTYIVKFADIRLYPDIYYLSFWCGDMSSSETYHYAEDVLSFEILDGGDLTTRTLPRSAGFFFFTPKWQIKQ